LRREGTKSTKEEFSRKHAKLGGIRKYLTWRLGAIDTPNQTDQMSREGVKRAKGGALSSRRNSNDESSVLAAREESFATIKSAAGPILAVTEERNWIEVFFEGDMMHTKTIKLPAGRMFDIYIEEIPHKTTVYEHPRTMVLFDGPCDLEISRDGGRVIVNGKSARASKSWA
jgi:hypothetical protein